MSFVSLFGEVDERAWMVRAQCRDVSPYLFYPDPWLPAERRKEMEREAKSVCAHCVVKGECLVWALEHNEENGVWGETTEAERRRIKKQRRRAS